MGKERKIKTNGRISKIGSYAIASSMPMRDHRQQPSITCTTFNILAPMYKRINLGSNQNSRESDCRAYWLARSNRILDSLLRERSSIICLQVFLGSIDSNPVLSLNHYYLFILVYSFSFGGDGTGIPVRKRRTG